MGHSCTHDDFPAPDKEHPVVAVIAIIAIIGAMLLIAWARIEVHGTRDIEAALVEPVEVQIEPRSPAEQELDAAVASSRFATGFSP
jgi:hypothetical protein